MTFTASLHLANLEGEPSDLILTGSTDGKSSPAWDFEESISRDLAKAWEGLLMEHYDEGLYGTGSVGEVRDMLYAMDQVAEELEVLLVVPEKTEKKAATEAEEAIEELPKGAVF